MLSRDGGGQGTPCQTPDEPQLATPTKLPHFTALYLPERRGKNLVCPHSLDVVHRRVLG